MVETLNKHPTQLEKAMAKMPHNIMRKLPFSIEVCTK